MNDSLALFLRCQKLFRFAAWGALVVVLFASSPFLFDLLGRGLDWITGLLPHSHRLWEEDVWSR